MSIALKQGGAIIALEWGALGLLGMQSNPWLLLGFFVLHGLASLLLALFARTIIFAGRERDVRWEVRLVFVCAFFVPILGAIGLLLTLLIYYRMERKAAFHPIGETTVPVFVQARKGDHAKFGPGGARSRLLNVHTPLEARVKALMLFQTIPTRLSGGLLKQVLTDPADDIRLLAYGMLDNREQQINQRIHQERDRLQEATTPQGQYSSARRLAGLYGELIYQGLVEGDVKAFALQEAEKYARQALIYRSDDAALLVQHAKLLQQQGRLAEAEGRYHQALALGMPQSRIVPWLAELHFFRRDFQRVRQLLRDMDSTAVPGSLGNILAYWKRPGGGQ